MRLNEWKSGQPGMTTASLAALCGVQRVAMHRIMSGETLPRWSTMDRIVRATDGAVTLPDLYAAHAEYKAKALDIPPVPVESAA